MKKNEIYRYIPTGKKLNKKMKDTDLTQFLELLKIVREGAFRARLIQTINPELNDLKRHYESELIKIEDDIRQCFIEGSKTERQEKISQKVKKPAQNECGEVEFIKKDFPPFYCFQTEEGKLIVVYMGENHLTVYGDTISAEPLKFIGTFEADGHGDYNWGVVGTVLQNKMKKSKCYKGALDIDKNGL